MPERSSFIAKDGSNWGTAAGRDLRNFHLMQAFLAARDGAREALVAFIVKLTVLAAALMYGLPLLLQHHH